MNEENKDIPLQISHLASFLEKNISHLDAPSTALLFLHCTILLNFEPEDSSNNEKRRLLSATVTAMRQQTVVLVSLLTGISSVNFRCYATQCAASTLMALETYSQSKEDFDLVFGCLTDPILQLLQDTGRIPNDETTTQPEIEINAPKRKKGNINESQLYCYIKDMNRIASVLSNTNGSQPQYLLPYNEGSRIEDRLSLLKSPIAELIKYSNYTAEELKMESSLPFVVIRLLSKRELGRSRLEWQTEVDFHLFLLLVGKSLDHDRTGRSFLIT